MISDAGYQSFAAELVLAARVDPYHDGKLVIRIPKRNEDIQIQAILVETGVLTRLWARGSCLKSI